MAIHKTAIVESDIPESVKVLEFAVIRPHVMIGEYTVIQEFAKIGERCRIGKNCRIGTGAVLRDGTVIGDYSTFGTLSASEGDNEIGNHVMIHSQCHITKHVVIEDRVFIAPMFVGANTRKICWGRNYPVKIEGYRIKYGARIAIGVCILPSVVVGREALIGAHSLVTHDIPDFAVAYGNPAKVVGSIPFDETLQVET